MVRFQRIKIYRTEVCRNTKCKIDFDSLKKASSMEESRNSQDLKGLIRQSLVTLLLIFFAACSTYKKPKKMTPRQLGTDQNNQYINTNPNITPINNTINPLNFNNVSSTFGIDQNNSNLPHQSNINNGLYANNTNQLNINSNIFHNNNQSQDLDSQINTLYLNAFRMNLNSSLINHILLQNQNNAPNIFPVTGTNLHTLIPTNNNTNSISNENIQNTETNNYYGSDQTSSSNTDYSTPDIPIPTNCSTDTSGIPKKKAVLEISIPFNQSIEKEFYRNDNLIKSQSFPRENSLDLNKKPIQKQSIPVLNFKNKNILRNQLSNKESNTSEFLKSNLNNRSESENMNTDENKEDRIQNMDVKDNNSNTNTQVDINNKTSNTASNNSQKKTVSIKTSTKSRWNSFSERFKKKHSNQNFEFKPSSYIYELPGKSNNDSQSSNFKNDYYKNTYSKRPYTCYKKNKSRYAPKISPKNQYRNTHDTSKPKWKKKRNPELLNKDTQIIKSEIPIKPSSSKITSKKESSSHQHTENKTSENQNTYMKTANVVRQNNLLPIKKSKDSNKKKEKKKNLQNKLKRTECANKPKKTKSKITVSKKTNTNTSNKKIAKTTSKVKDEQDRSSRRQCVSLDKTSSNSQKTSISAGESTDISSDSKTQDSVKIIDDTLKYIINKIDTNLSEENLVPNTTYKQSPKNIKSVQKQKTKPKKKPKSKKRSSKSRKKPLKKQNKNNLSKNKKSIKKNNNNSSDEDKKKKSLQEPKEPAENGTINLAIRHKGEIIFNEIFKKNPKYEEFFNPNAKIKRNYSNAHLKELFSYCLLDPIKINALIILTNQLITLNEGEINDESNISIEKIFLPNLLNPYLYLINYFSNQEDILRDLYDLMGCKIKYGGPVLHSCISNGVSTSFLKKLILLENNINTKRYSINNSYEKGTILHILLDSMRIDLLKFFLKVYDNIDSRCLFNTITCQQLDALDIILNLYSKNGPKITQNLAKLDFFHLSILEIVKLFDNKKSRFLNYNYRINFVINKIHTLYSKIRTSLINISIVEYYLRKHIDLENLTLLDLKDRKNIIHTIIQYILKPNNVNVFTEYLEYCYE